MFYDLFWFYLGVVDAHDDVTALGKIAAGEVGQELDGFVLSGLFLSNSPLNIISINENICHFQIN